MAITIIHKLGVIVLTYGKPKIFHCSPQQSIKPFGLLRNKECIQNTFGLRRSIFSKENGTFILQRMMVKTRTIACTLLKMAAQTHFPVIGNLKGSLQLLLINGPSMGMFFCLKNTIL